MTCVIECVRTSLRANERFESTEPVWYQLLGLALEHGWLPAGATPWHSSKGPLTDYSPPDWLHAKTVSRTDAFRMAKSLHAVATSHPLWAIAEHFAVYCDGGGFVFACDETDQFAASVDAAENLPGRLSSSSYGA